MPRIDPVQLLNCLSVLLSPNGGIKSTDEVQRLANLMTKFSKKLVSKCIYVQILKCTETELLGLFMGSGGWRLVHTWLTESIVAKNWPLVKELLELLLLCPVDIERLKTNNCPKLVKELSKDGNHFAIRALASKLVEQWLKTVKGEMVIPVKLSEIALLISEAQLETNFDGLIKTEATTENEKLDKEIKPINDNTKQLTLETNSNLVSDQCDSKIKDELDKKPETLPVLKISVKDEKQTISEVDEDEKSADDKEKSKENRKSKDKSDKNRSSSSSKHSSKSHSSSSDKKSSNKSSSHSSSSNRHSSKDRSKDKDKHSSHLSKSKHSDSNSKPSSDKSSSSKKSKEEKNKSDKDKPKDKTKNEKNDRNKDEKKNEKNDKNKDNEKNKDLKSSSHRSEDKTPSIHKLGKIPKLSDVKKDKPSISIEVRKPDEPKPKTVKTFHSKFRKHGLEEEVKPPPSRAALLNKKPPPPLPPIIPAPKRPSPAHNETPPEKKPKTQEVVEKPGAIKLIPPKPKPMMLLESDMFMDALNASATNKKEPKKRKRRTSGSKDGGPASESSPPQTPTTITSPAEKSVPPRFYQDTLDTDAKEKEKSSKSPDKTDVTEKDPEVPMDTAEPHTLTVNGLKGVLCYHKRKGPKKSIKWKPDSELEEVQYFELDETERVNVTKTFTDMKHLERIHEREAFQKARNLSTVDLMEERTNWRPLVPVDTDGQIEVEYGKNSKEKEIQAIRQKGTLQPLYFHKSMIPDSPLEAEPESHPYTEPTIIPLDDVTGNTDNVSDFRNMPWPDPKGNAPPSSSSNTNMPMFPPNMGQFPGGFPPAQFHGMPGFPAPAMIPPDWQNNMAMMANGMPGMPPAVIGGAMPPGMMVPPDNMMMTPDMFGAPNPMFPVGPDGFNMQPNMFPMDFNMAGLQGPPGPGQGPGLSGPGNFRGAKHGRGGGPSSSNWRGKGSGGWDGARRGRNNGPSRGGRKVCMYFQQKGSCRQGDKCTFLHPGVNGPY